ncbi:hypothetical protein DYU11_19300 [Fibrisoma montanum]|uniref:Uncharacterized protein n=1 Tax=Fibrisoma montanum TaxID=2305895 RepID=A0A418M6H9_9BACT|nr:hypothetical protein DYU11_19300 [Fibrisoma montanum]
MLVEIAKTETMACRSAAASSASPLPNRTNQAGAVVVEPGTPLKPVSSRFQFSTVATVSFK